MVHRFSMAAGRTREWLRVEEAQTPVLASGPHFEALAAEHLPDLFGAAVRMTRDEQDAQDLCCQALVQAHRDLDAWQPSTDFRKWLVGVLAETYVTTRPGEDGRCAAPDPVRGPASDGRAAPAGASRNQRLQTLLDGLPDEMRIPVLLHDVEGLAYQEIARALNIPLGSVRSRIFRGRSRLREALA